MIKDVISQRGQGEEVLEFDAGDYPDLPAVMKLWSTKVGEAGGN